MALQLVQRSACMDVCTLSNTLDYAVASSNLAVDITNLLQCPPVAAAASLVQCILTLVQDLKNNKQGCIRLAVRAARLLIYLNKRMDGKWELAPPGLLENVRDFEETLTLIRNFMQNLSDMTWIMRLLLNSRIADDLRDLNFALEDSAHAFQIASLIEIHYALRVPLQGIHWPNLTAFRRITPSMSSIAFTSPSQSSIPLRSMSSRKTNKGAQVNERIASSISLDTLTSPSQSSVPAEMTSEDAQACTALMHTKSMPSEMTSEGAQAGTARTTAVERIASSVSSRTATSLSQSSKPIMRSRMTSTGNRGDFARFEREAVTNGRVRLTGDYVLDLNNVLVSNNPGRLTWQFSDSGHMYGAVATLNGAVVAQGAGHSKGDAKQMAAGQVLRMFGVL